MYTSTSPLGPYTFQGRDIACQKQEGNEQHKSDSPALSSSFAAEPTPGQGCLFYGEGLASVTRAQQNFVIEVRARRWASG